MLFKKHISRSVLLRFGIPSVAAAVAGALLLDRLGKSLPIAEYNLGGNMHSITALKIVIGSLLLVFACFELIPRLKNLTMPEKYLPAGGLLSGFFGGLSGHQGALRSMFLLRLRLSKEQFIATGVAIACLIDVSRLSVYAVNIRKTADSLNYYWLAAAAISAFAGAWIGNRLLKKITITLLQYFVAIFIILFSIALIAGLV